MKQELYRILRYIFKGVPEQKINIKVVQTSENTILRGKRVLVTGGNRGLGFEIAKALIRYGASVIISGRNVDSLKDASKRLNCDFIKLDIDDIDAFSSAFDNIIMKYNGLDCIVHNAGISLHENSLFEVTPKNWDAQFATNLKGPYFLSQIFIKYLLKNNKRGNLLFISSETGDTADFRPYGITKAALNSMVKGIAYLYKANGIRVNALAPGVTATEMTGISKNRNLSCEGYGEGRFYLPEEIAELACMLISDISNSISGQIITCNNAQTVNARWK